MCWLANDHNTSYLLQGQGGSTTHHNPATHWLACETNPGNAWVINTIGTLGYNVGNCLCQRLNHTVTFQCSAVQCSAVQCSAVQSSAVPVQCSAVQCSAVQCSPVQSSAVQCRHYNRHCAVIILGSACICTGTCIKV